jgi:tRNA isopentenyl-2-thiomethyl-A-37 hydroxylase MiaE
MDNNAYFCRKALDIVTLLNPEHQKKLNYDAIQANIYANFMKTVVPDHEPLTYVSNLDIHKHLIGSW